MSTIWADGLEKIRPYIFEIHTPRGSGTGFQLSNSAASNIVGVATALHVVEYATIGNSL